MEVIARKVDLAQAPASIARLVTPGQVFVTAGKRYEVFAAVVFEGRLTLQIVDDLRYPAWLPVWLFEVVDPTLPPDWICNLFHDEPALLLGPPFIAKDQAAHASMVELEADQVDRFWKRVDALHADETNETA
jgi:hypothetical protein